MHQIELVSLLHSQIVWGGGAYSWTSFLEEAGHSIIRSNRRRNLNFRLDIWVTISFLNNYLPTI